MQLDSAAARAAAFRAFWASYLGRQRITLPLPPKYATVEPGDILRLPGHGTTRLVNVLSKDRGANGLIELSVVPDFPKLVSYAPPV